MSDEKFKTATTAYWFHETVATPSSSSSSSSSEDPTLILSSTSKNEQDDGGWKQTFRDSIQMLNHPLPNRMHPEENEAEEEIIEEEEEEEEENETYDVSIHQYLSETNFQPPEPSESSYFHKFLICIKKYLGGTVGIVLGLSLGLILGWHLREEELNEIESQWIELPGNLFKRCLNALVGPLLFTTLSVSSCDMILIGQQQNNGILTSLLFLLTSFLGAIQGVFWGNAFTSLFKSTNSTIIQEREQHDKYLATFALRCSNGKFLSLQTTTNTLSCDQVSLSPKNTTLTHFNAIDIQKQLQFLNLTSNSYIGLMDKSTDTQIYNMIESLVPKNIVLAFTRDVLMTIVTIALIFGITMAITSYEWKMEKRKQTYKREHKVVDTEGNTEKGTGKGSLPSTSSCASCSSSHCNYVLEFIRQLNQMLLILLDWLMKTVPFMIVFIVMKMIIRDKDDHHNILHNFVLLPTCLIIAQVFHILVVLPFVYYIFHRQFPYLALRKMVPAMVYGFASSSSLRTLPVAIWCMNSTKKVSTTHSRRVFQSGATINMDGLAIYLPIACIFILKVSGFDRMLTWWLFTKLVLLSTIASIGAPPVPNGGLVMVLAVWQSTAGYFLPLAFTYVLIVEWFEDRIQTAINIFGDAVVCLISAPLINETYEDEQIQNLREQLTSPNTSTFISAS